MRTSDKTDERLVQLLREDAKRNSQELAKQLKLSAATVRRRLRKLLGGGLLQIVGVIDPAKFGFPLATLIAVNVAHNELESAVKTLADEPGIVWLSTTTGRFDVMAIAQFRSIDALSEFLTKKLPRIEGIKDSETFVCLDIQKGTCVQIPL